MLSLITSLCLCLSLFCFCLSLSLSVCNLTCPEGFTVDLGCTVCNLTDICLADNPCQNEGVCTLNSEPDDYMCNCTKTNYIGTNCTGKI